MRPAVGPALAGIVLAAGVGSRLRPLTRIKPKALCPINNVPMVDLALARLRAVGITDIAVNAHHLAEQLVAHLVGRVHLSVEQPAALGTAGAVGALRSWLAGRDALICNADAYLDGDIAPLLDGWTGQRPRVLVVPMATESDFGRWRFAGASLLPAAYASRLSPSPSGLFEVVWRPSMERGQLEHVAHQGMFIDCGTPQEYLAANLHRSGGANVIGRGAVVEGELRRCVVWPDGVVARHERLVEAVRVGRTLTVNCTSPARR